MQHPENGATPAGLPQVSVVIPTYNSPTVTDALRAIAAQTRQEAIAEVLLVGPDHHVAGDEHPLLRRLSATKRLSASVARSLGAQHARGDLIWFLDSDVIATPTALERLLAARERHGYDCVSAGIIPEGGSYWRLAANLMAFPDCLTISAPGGRMGLPSFSTLMTRAVWQQFGPYDARFGGVWEDMDLCYRMRRGGATIGCAPAAAVYHRPPRASMRASFLRHQAYGTRLVLFYHKHGDVLPPSRARWAIERLGSWASPALLALAVLYVLRLLLTLPELRAFWYAVPGMMWLQYGSYLGSLASDPARGAP